MRQQLEIPAMPAIPACAPQPGQLVHIRQRCYLVEDVTPSPAVGEATAVSLSCVDGDAQGQPDAYIAGICQAEQRALITLDLDLADLRRYPPADHAGIIVLCPATQSIPAVLALIQCLVLLLDQEPVAGALWIVDGGRVRIPGAAHKPHRESHHDPR
jgi:hypothetical protein